MKKQILATLGAVLLLTACEDLFDDKQTSNTDSQTETGNSGMGPDESGYSVSLDSDSSLAILAIVDSLSEFNDGYESFDTPERRTLLSGTTGSINRDCSIAGQVSLNIQSDSVTDTISNQSIYTQCQRDQFEINGELDYLYEDVRSFFNMIINVQGEISFTNINDNSSFTLKNYSKISNWATEINEESMTIEIISDGLTGVVHYDLYENESSGNEILIISGSQNSEFKVEKEDYLSDSVCTLNTQTVDCYTYSFY